jgi:NAD(P)-dependent dehydrogenase (short-subunit alcohol dehydrogenase family)
MKAGNLGVAIVTGASSGIGKATAKALAGAGYRVFGTSRRPMDRSDGLAMLVCDVTNEASVNRLVETVLSETGRIDLLVNNAGMGLLGGAEESSIDQAKALFDVNLFGILRMTNAVLPTMRQQRAGRIVNVSSILGLIPSPFNALYSSTKHALEGYSESLDHEVRGFGVRVTLVEPGFTQTAFEMNTMTPDRALPVYDSVRLDMEIQLRKGVCSGDDPDVVARAVVEAATAAAPKRRYAAGRLAKQVRLLRWLVPEAAFDKSLRKQASLPA